MSKKVLLLVFLFSLFLVGCENESSVVSDGKKVDTSKMVHEHCTRAGTIDDGDVSLNYDLYYTGEVLNILVGEEKVISPTQSVLDTYEQAYKDVHKRYEGLEYYDTEVVRGDNTVTSKVTINYDKINTQRLLSIEGSEDNIFENGVAKVEKWKALIKKFGGSCTAAED